MSILNLRKELKTKKIVFGTERTIKLLKNRKIEKIYVSSNCPKTVKDDLVHYTKLSNITLEELSETNEDLGVICKKPFLVSVLSILK